jgi:hypothetical protein
MWKYHILEDYTFKVVRQSWFQIHVLSPVLVGSASFNRQEIDIQPLQTYHPTEYERRASTQSITAIPSPSSVAARACHLQRRPPIGHEWNAKQRRKSLFEAQQTPRRHSAFTPQGELAVRMATLKVIQDLAQATQGAIAAAAATTTKVEKEEEIPLIEFDSKESSMSKDGYSWLPKMTLER